MAEYLDDEALNIYTDGSAYSGRRRGGVGVLFVYVDSDGREVREDFPLVGFESVTNNAMELQAPIEALRALLRGAAPVELADYRKIVFWTDSMYVCDNYRNAQWGWRANRWMTKDGNPVENAELWKELVNLAQKTRVRVDFKWVKGHRKSAGNKRADRLAKESAKTQVGRRLAPERERVRRKLSPNVTERGSVGMRGQVETIRIITEDPKYDGLIKYRFEVVGPESDFFEKVDLFWAAGDLMLRVGHIYEVRFNDRPAQPRVVEVLREVVGP